MGCIILLEQQNIDENSIAVAHDGADEVSLDAKAKLKGNITNLKVGYTGHLYKGKGIEVIEKIASQVSKEIEFHIVGGTDEDIEYWQKKIVSKNVYFYGFVAQKDVSSYINAFDVCVLPNQKVVLTHGAKNDKNNISGFTSPLKMFEYMAHKKAIIASDLPVLREVLNETNAILVGCDNTKAWIEAINKLRNKGTREKLANQAYDDFKKEYSWKQRAFELIKDL